MFNSIGTILRLTTFGESHGAAIGGVLDGFPAGIEVDENFIQSELNKRKPGQSSITTQRKEEDKVQFLSGIFNGKTTGASIGFQILNTNAKSQDYSHLQQAFRPNHADFTYTQKYGNYDYRGGGRTSARETANWVVAGAMAKLLLQRLGPPIKFTTYTDSVGPISLPRDFNQSDINPADINANEVRCPHAPTAAAMIQEIKEVRKAGDTIGGTVFCKISNVPVGIGEPIFHKLHAQLAHAMLSINACKGIEFGDGFESTSKRGSEFNDLFSSPFSQKQPTKTNHSGGIQGGISNGMPIEFRVAFKPVATLMQSQPSINADFEATEIQGKGRHDPCVVPRAVPIVEAMAAFVLADYLMIQPIRKL